MLQLFCLIYQQQDIFTVKQFANTNSDILLQRNLNLTIDFNGFATYNNILNGNNHYLTSFVAHNGYFIKQCNNCTIINITFRDFRIFSNDQSSFIQSGSNITFQNVTISSLNLRSQQAAFIKNCDLLSITNSTLNIKFSTTVSQTLFKSVNSQQIDLVFADIFCTGQQYNFSDNSIEQKVTNSQFNFNLMLSTSNFNAQFLKLSNSVIKITDLTKNLMDYNLNNVTFIKSVVSVFQNLTKSHTSTIKFNTINDSDSKLLIRGNISGAGANCSYTMNSSNQNNNTTKCNAGIGVDCSQLIDNVIRCNYSNPNFEQFFKNVNISHLVDKDETYGCINGGSGQLCLGCLYEQIQNTNNQTLQLNQTCENVVSNMNGKCTFDFTNYTMNCSQCDTGYKQNTEKTICYIDLCGESCPNNGSCIQNDTASRYECRCVGGFSNQSSCRSCEVDYFRINNSCARNITSEIGTCWFVDNKQYCIDCIEEYDLINNLCVAKISRNVIMIATFFAIIGCVLLVCLILLIIFLIKFCKLIQGMDNGCNKRDQAWQHRGKRYQDYGIMYNIARKQIQQPQTANE